VPQSIPKTKDPEVRMAINEPGCYHQSTRIDDGFRVGGAKAAHRGDPIARESEVSDKGWAARAVVDLAAAHNDIITGFSRGGVKAGRTGQRQRKQERRRSKHGERRLEWTGGGWGVRRCLARRNVVVD